MGFTRYFEGNVNLTEEFVSDVKRIVGNSGIAINGWDGTGIPTITSEEIRLNGSEADGESCETFLITNGENSGFCKTAYQPYDLVVATILRRAEALNSDFEASSDGGNNESAVTAYYNKLFS